jgi:hypothetical protein
VHHDRVSRQPSLRLSLAGTAILSALLSMVAWREVLLVSAQNRVVRRDDESGEVCPSAALSY